MALFTKSYKELREEFVRGRFGEFQHFGCEDIEIRILNEAGRRMPDPRYWEDRALAQCVEQAADYPPDRWCAILKACGTNKRYPSVDPAEGFELGQLRKEHRSFLDELERHWPVYRGFRAIALIPMDGHLTAIEPRWDQRGNCHAALVRAEFAHIVDAAYASWRNSCVCMPSQSCRSEAAASFLREVHAKYVAQMRASAEDDFDRAVAVTEDGKKILHADEVIVYRMDKAWRFEPSAFFEKKIKCLQGSDRHPNFRGFTRLDKDVKSVRIGATTLDEYDYLSTLLCLLESDVREQASFYSHQVFFKAPDKTTFWTVSEFCPDPLPEGGTPL